jgi:hypothetical protein
MIPGLWGTRQIGIQVLEDKVLQRAVVLLLQPINPQALKLCSYGVQPGRAAVIGR